MHRLLERGDWQHGSNWSGILQSQKLPHLAQSDLVTTQLYPLLHLDLSTGKVSAMVKGWVTADCLNVSKSSWLAMITHRHLTLRSFDIGCDTNIHSWIFYWLLPGCVSFTEFSSSLWKGSLANCSLPDDPLAVVTLIQCLVSLCQLHFDFLSKICAITGNYASM